MFKTGSLWANALICLRISWLKGSSLNSLYIFKDQRTRLANIFIALCWACRLSATIETDIYENFQIKNLSSVEKPENSVLIYKY